MNISVEFDESDWDSFHDVIAEVLIDTDPKTTTKYYSGKEKIFNELPRHIRFDAYQWGLSDTVFRDNAYVWLLNNWEKVEGIV